MAKPKAPSKTKPGKLPIKAKNSQPQQKTLTWSNRKHPASDGSSSDEEHKVRPARSQKKTKCPAEVEEEVKDEVEKSDEPEEVVGPNGDSDDEPEGDESDRENHEVLITWQ